jgi:hypothetical protein
VIEAVDRALQQNAEVDSITVAGNGEPTLHPGFAPIAEGLFHLRNRRAPRAKLTLLSNGSTLDRLDVVYSLPRFDVRCMKLDAGDATTYRLMNAGSISLGAAHRRPAIGRTADAAVDVRARPARCDRQHPTARGRCVGRGGRSRAPRERRSLYARASAGARHAGARAGPVLDEIAARVEEIGIRTRVFA